MNINLEKFNEPFNRDLLDNDFGLVIKTFHLGIDFIPKGIRFILQVFDKKIYFLLIKIGERK